MQQATNLESVDNVCSQICTLVLSKKEAVSLVAQLEKGTLGAFPKYGEEDDKEWAAEDLKERTGTYRVQTAFGRHFDSVLTSV